MPDRQDLLAALVDLTLGSACVGCSSPGRLLCDRCRADLPGDPAPAWPTPTPAGMVVPWASGDYAGTVRAMVLGLKEQRLLALARPVSGLLADAVRAGILAEAPGLPVTLVPVPSRASSVRARGHDPTWTVTAGAARSLRREGHDVVALRLLHTRPGVLDQSGLDATARAANLAGSMAVRPGRLRRLARVRPSSLLVVCDDVLTTGSTAREAQRALEAVGLPVGLVATVAATRRRIPVVRADGRRDPADPGQIHPA